MFIMKRFILICIAMALIGVLVLSCGTLTYMTADITYTEMNGNQHYFPNAKYGAKKTNRINGTESYGSVSNFAPIGNRNGEYAIITEDYERVILSGGSTIFRNSREVSASVRKSDLVYEYRNLNIMQHDLEQLLDSLSKDCEEYRLKERELNEIKDRMAEISARLKSEFGYTIKTQKYNYYH